MTQFSTHSSLQHQNSSSNCQVRVMKVSFSHGLLIKMDYHDPKSSTISSIHGIINMVIQEQVHN